MARPLTTTVGIVIVNLNGAAHLRHCLDSLAGQDYPRALTKVVVVDNGSTDGSRELMARAYPWVTVLAQEGNTGFAPAVNTGVRALDTECVALLNNDMRVEHNWLSALARAYDPGAGVVCVGARILSWDGTKVDFCEGGLSFSGHGVQIGFGRPVDSVRVRDGGELLFACAGAMLVGRDVYLGTGGLDDRFFAYFEDVDFGWRLRVLGYRTVLAGDAVCYHRHHGTSSAFPDHERILLYERNAIRCMVKNYDRANLDRTLGPALLLLAKRAVLRGGLDRAEYDVGRQLPVTAEVPRVVLSHLHALADLVDNLDELMAAREMVQRARQVPDEEIIARFGRPLLSVLPEPAHIEAHGRVVSRFDLRETFARQRAHHMLVVSNDEVGTKMSGPAIRAFELARALAATVDVTLAVPSPFAAGIAGLSVAVYDDEAGLCRLAQSADIVMVQGYTLRNAPSVADVGAVLVVDLYDAWLFENLELRADVPFADPPLRYDLSVVNEQLDRGDFFVCASERQRDYWMGMLAARDRLSHGTYGRDPTLRQLIDVVPFGLSDSPPRHLRPVLKGAHPAIGADDLVVLWGGGAWDWFDPLSVIDAFARVVELVPKAKLYFLGLQLDREHVVQMRMGHRAVQRAEELGLAGTSVVFGDWAPYELREAYLLEADVAVSAARDLAETRLAFRSRVLDYLWAGLPVVATGGDVLSELVQAEGLGLVVEPGDVAALADALVRLLSDPVLRAGCAERARAVAGRYTWSRAVEPLRRVALEPWKWRVGRELRGRKWPLTEDVQLMLAHREAEYIHFRNEAAHWRQAGEALQSEADRVRAELDELKAVVAHQDRRLAQLRATPAYPLVKALLRAKRRVAGPR
ncbi:MAG: glycosyltransferase [Acidimicrobiales bacterium]